MVALHCIVSECVRSSCGGGKRSHQEPSAARVACVRVDNRLPVVALLHEVKRVEDAKLPSQMSM